MSTETVVTNGLTKRYGDKNVVDGVHLRVRAGEIYGFLGPNGAGKTTTLRMLVGLVRPTSGTATVLGSPPGAPAAAARTGVLIEGPGFHPYLSGLDNLRFLSRLRGLPDDAAVVALERVGLGARGNDKFRTYSLGMKQRLGVAAALVGEPDLLILDEPTNGLDPAGVAEMRALIVDLAKQGHTIVLSSHMLTEVQEMCDRVGVISDGRLLVESTVSELRGATRLFVRANPLGRAEAVVRELLGDGVVTRVQDGIEISVPGDRAPKVAEALVRDGVDLLELTSQERTLEDAFFEMTGAQA